jgi:N-acetylglucosaminyldiphosphoundecaprenol N-acetyl-beta-D-mannosaminyltransferase
VSAYRGGSLRLRHGLPRLSILGTFVHATSLGAAQRALSSFVEDRSARQIVTVNLDFLAVSYVRADFKRVINDAALTVMDGKPLVWMARYLGLRDCERVTGPDLIRAAAEISIKDGTRIFLLGGSPEAAEGTRLTLEREYPGVQICGAYAPPEAPYPFPAHLDAEICNRLAEAAPDVLFVGFGAPKQELWIRDHLDELDIPVAIGIGGSFNFLSGSVSRAPAVLQRLGLEWSYRLWKEPRRLWRRYVLQDIPFMLRVIAIESLAKLRIARSPALKLEATNDQY